MKKSIYNNVNVNNNCDIYCHPVPVINIILENKFGVTLKSPKFP